MKRDVGTFVSAAFALEIALTLALGGCHGRDDAANRAAVATLDQALGPAFFAAALRKLGGGHYHGTTRMSVTAGATANNEAGWDTVTTTTDVWLDRTGNYRILETNDQDGGREVVLFGRELNVALRYGKMIRRVAQDPEPERLLEEALGGPWAAWQMAAPFAILQRRPIDLESGRKGEDYRVTRSERRSRKASATPAPRGMKEWRSTASVLELDGHMTVDRGSGGLLKADLVVVFAAHRPGDPAGDAPAAETPEPAEPIVGTVEVQTAVDGLGSTGSIERPPAEDLSLRQRIVPEQKDLLSGLTAPARAATEDGKRP